MTNLSFHNLTCNEGQPAGHQNSHQARAQETNARFDELVAAKNATLNNAEGETINWDDY